MNNEAIFKVVVSPLQSVCEHNPEKELLMAIPSGLGRHQATPPLPPPPPYPLSTDNVQGEGVAMVTC